MKILHVIPELGKGGAERLVLNIVSELSKREGIIVKLITFRDTNSYPFLMDSIDWQIVPATLIPSITGKSRIEVEALKQAIQNFQPDVIHTHLFEAEIIVKEIPQKHTIYFTHFHDNMPPFKKLGIQSFFNKSKLLRYFERRWILKKYQSVENYFIAISQDGLNYLHENLPIKLHKNIQLIPNAIEYDRFYVDRDYENKDNERWQLVTIGSLVPRKGHEFLIRVVKYLKENNYNVELKIIGGGTHKDQLLKNISRFGLTDSIQLLGYVQYPENYLKHSDLYIHAATHEPFGLVLIEAMASSLPVITTDGKGNRDLIIDGENGFLIESRDVELFASKVIQLLSNDDLRETMGKKAQLFSKEFAIEKYVDTLLNTYHKTLKKGKPIYLAYPPYKLKTRLFYNY